MQAVPRIDLRPIRRLAAGAVLALLFAGPAAAAAERKLVLDYRIYVGGFRTVDMAFDSRIRPDSYSMSLRLDGRGIIEWLFTWNMTAESEGRLDGGRVIPVRASSRSNWRGKERRIDVEFPGDGRAPVSSVDPAPKDDERDPVPDELRRGTVDLAGAIVAALRSAGETGRCDYRARVFDGRRRYDLVFADEGEARLAPTDYSAFSGPAMRCSLRLEQIAGFRKKHSRTRWATSESATIWIARLFPDTRPVPVRLELETVVGQLRGHVVDATLSGDGATRRIAAPE